MSDAPDSTTPQQVVGRNILRILSEQDMAQAELARRLGVDASTVNLYIRGTIDMGVSRLKAVSDILDVPPCHLLREGVAA